MKGSWVTLCAPSLFSPLEMDVVTRSCLQCDGWYQIKHYLIPPLSRPSLLKKVPCDICYCSVNLTTNFEN